ncbi:OBP30, partial [Halyomorpha halys]
ADP